MVCCTQSTCCRSVREVIKKLNKKTSSSDEGLTLWVDSLWRRVNARNVSFSISVRWSIYIINSVDKPNFQIFYVVQKKKAKGMWQWPLAQTHYPGSVAAMESSFDFISMAWLIMPGLVLSSSLSTIRESSDINTKIHFNSTSASLQHRSRNESNSRMHRRRLTSHACAPVIFLERSWVLPLLHCETRATSSYPLVFPRAPNQLLCS